VELHVAFPHYRPMFQEVLAARAQRELQALRAALPPTRIHPAEDRAFYYRAPAGPAPDLALRLALIFQRDVAARLLPLVRPHLLHAGDWMTGLLPAAARARGLPCLFTLHQAHTRQAPLTLAEHCGWDPQPFWRQLYYARMPEAYEQTRQSNPVDFLASGVFAADFLTAASPSYLNELAAGAVPQAPAAVSREAARQQAAGAAAGILFPPHPSFDPATDDALPARYGPDDHPAAKRRCKQEFLRAVGLPEDDAPPLFFWPSRLQPEQKGCELLLHLLPEIAARPERPLRVALVADGLHQKPFRDLVEHRGLGAAVAVRGFAPELSRLGYAAADYVLAPALWEPAGRAAMTALRYGALPVARRTGALADLLRHLEPARDAGNGFVFETYDANGLRWAIEQALAFHQLPAAARAAQIARVMREAQSALTLEACARRHAALYAALAGARPAPPEVAP